MKNSLKIYNIPYGTDEWYHFRKNGIGGSEIGTVLGLNKYETIARLFHEKVGTVEMRKEENEKMLWGRVLEETVAKMWSYYDGTKDGYIKNFKDDKIIRKCRKLNGYVVNPDYPWLFGSPDRLINIEGGINLITGESLKTEAVLECKNLGYWMTKIWADGLPIYFLAQVHIYMIILDTDYAEIAILRDGNDFEVEKIIRDDNLCDKIIEVSKSFWYNRIVPAKKAYENLKVAESNRNFTEMEKWEAEIQKYEPEPDTSEAYEQFMNERFLKTRESVKGTMDIYNLAKKDKVLLGLNNLIDKERTNIKNIILKQLYEKGSDMIDFDNLGYILWDERKGSKNRTFVNRIKEKPTEEQLLKEFIKINFDCY